MMAISLDSASQRVAARGGRAPPRRSRRDQHARRGKSPVAADHDIGATRERLADRKIGLAPHHHRLAHGGGAEVLHVGSEPPRQRVRPARSRHSRPPRRPGRARCCELRPVRLRRRRSLRSHRHLGLDVRVRVIAFEGEILVAEGEQVGRRRIEHHARQRAAARARAAAAPARDD